MTDEMSENPGAGATMVDHLIEAWRTNNRINLYLLDNISDAGLECTLSKRGGRGVAGQFAHIHSVRVWHLERRARDLAAGLQAIPAKQVPGREELKTALRDSAEAIESFLRGLAAGEPKRRGFKKGIPTTLAYLVAHESHHRGSILLTLKTCGHKVDRDVAYAIWAWDKM